MKFRHFGWSVLVLLAMPAWASVAPAAPLNPLQTYQQLTTTPVGQGQFKWLVFNVFQAKLFAPQGAYQPGQPHVLELTYQRHIPGRFIVQATLDEMARLGYPDATQLESYRPLLTQAFADVHAGTRLAGVLQANGSTAFIRDGQTLVGTIPGPRFGKYFFAIWLSENSRQPSLRQQLLNLTTPAPAAVSQR
jgi:hypothetical protein